MKPATGWYIIQGINPEPWTAPSVAVGRKNGKPFSIVHKNAALDAYQRAIREAMHAKYPEVIPGDETPLAVSFYLWRELPEYSSKTGKRVLKHQSDATNMQKALEDALQGILYVNDRDNHQVSTTIVEQSSETQPLIMIYISLPGVIGHSILATADRIKMQVRSDQTNKNKAETTGVF